jgi:hypothetical protein
MSKLIIGSKGKDGYEPFVEEGAVPIKIHRAPFLLTLLQVRKAAWAKIGLWVETEDILKQARLYLSFRCCPCPDSIKWDRVICPTVSFHQKVHESRLDLHIQLPQDCPLYSTANFIGGIELSWRRMVTGTWTVLWEIYSLEQGAFYEEGSRTMIFTSTAGKSGG